MSLESFLVVGAIIFSIGLYGALSKRNAIAVLMCIELMFNGVNITAVALSRYVTPASLTESSQGATYDMAQLVLTGQVFAVFIITVAAAEIALGLGIVFAMYRTSESVDLTEATQLRN